MNEHERLPPPHESAPPEPDDLGALTDDAITADFRIFQRARGHRYSLDDVITAWEAANLAPSAKRALELGTGIGSVLLMLAYKLRDTQFVAVEAQRNSFRLLTENVKRNGLEDRVSILRGDLRAVVGTPLVPGPFDLITGTPPYVPPGTATPASDAQKVFARQEMRGGVEAYVEAAARVLAPNGRVVVCGDARFPERAEGAARAHGLVLIRRREVLPREGQAPLFSVFSFARAGEVSAAPELTSWVARDAKGARTQDYREIRGFFGLPSPDDEVPSP